MDPQTERLVRQIHATPAMIVLVTTGAGAQAVAWLLGVPGASRTLLELLVPYSAASFRAFLGGPPDGYVRAETARALARQAYHRALVLRPDPSVAVAGVACTASIVTDRPKRGDHRCHVALWEPRRRVTHSLTLVKGLRDRRGEDDAVSRLLLRTVAEACGLRPEGGLDLDPREEVRTEVLEFADAVEALMAGQVEWVLVDAEGGAVADAPVRGALLSGSFNPLHRGHERLAAVARRKLGEPVTFELSVLNVDKPHLEEDQVRRRLTQFEGRYPVAVTRAPTFYQKARLFPGVDFVIGWDTAVRLVDPKYYEGDRAEMLRALLELRERGTRFLVAGRVDGGRFHTLEDIAVPPGLEDMFIGLSEEEFREDISSTELRRRGKGV